MYTIQVEPDSGEKYVVKIGTRDVLAWEKTGRNRTVTQLDKPSMGDLYALTHLGAKRMGLFAGSIQEFETSCEISIQVEEEPVPTRPAP